MNAEVLAIGDEITSGQLLDTNSQWLSQRLAELGIRVLHHTTVGDDLQASIAVFRRAIARADVVVATGGLGPTADDLTREALATAVGRPLVEVPEALEHIQRLFAYRKRPMPPQNKLQALFPEGSCVMPNPHGTAPGIDLDAPRRGGTCRVFCLPGVPAEMREMWDGYLAGALRGIGAGGRFILRHNIKCFGAGESQIESMLPDLIRRGRTPIVGINATQATIILRIVAQGASEAQCNEQIDSTAAIIRQCLGKLVYTECNEELQDVVLRQLQERGHTLATAELGITAGQVADWLGGAIDGRNGYRGGLVAADTAVLADLLGIDAATLPHDAAMVEAMAIACRDRFRADYGLAVGSFAGNAGHTVNAKPVHLAMASPNGVSTLTIPLTIHPDLHRVYCAKHALNMLRLELLK